MNYKSFNLGDWIGHISGAIEDERELDGNEMRDLVEFLSGLPKWIPVSERLPKEKEFPCLASDKWGQMWIPVSVVTINNRCFDGKDFEFDVEKFFKGKEVTMCDGVKVRELPREIVAWMPLPEPYKEGKEE